MNYVQWSKWIQSTGDLLTTYPVHCTWCVPVLLGITLWWTKFSCSYAKEVYISAFCVTYYFILEKLEYGNVVWPKAQASINRAIWRMNHHPTISIRETNWVSQRIEIYLVNSVNYLLNNYLGRGDGSSGCGMFDTNKNILSAPCPLSMLSDSVTLVTALLCLRLFLTKSKPVNVP